MCLLIAFLAEAVNNVGGLGFNGFDENGIAKWDRLTIVNVLRLEVLQYNITLSNILHVPCVVVMMMMMVMMIIMTEATAQTSLELSILLKFQSTIKTTFVTG